MTWSLNLVSLRLSVRKKFTRQAYSLQCMGKVLTLHNNPIVWWIDDNTLGYSLCGYVTRTTIKYINATFKAMDMENRIRVIKGVPFMILPNYKAAIDPFEQAGVAIIRVAHVR